MIGCSTWVRVGKVNQQRLETGMAGPFTSETRHPEGVSNDRRILHKGAKPRDSPVAAGSFAALRMTA
jgi:hypothetical protein